MVKDLLENKPPIEGLSYPSTVAAMECEDVDHDVALNEEVAKLKFDMMLIDIFPLSYCLTFMALRHSVPFMTAPPAIYMELMRVPALPSFSPELFTTYSDNMSFKERLHNTLVAIMLSVPAIDPFVATKDVSLVMKYSKDPSVVSWRDVVSKSELYFVSRGHILEYPMPLNPNVINIECLSCKPANPLSQDVEAMIGEAKGIIVVSFGSLVDEFPEYIAKRFLKAFSTREEIIFWRYKRELPGPVPANVKVMKWLPQNDLLAHPKTKLFITHSGNNGQYEAVYHGVPMLAFPLFAEQPHNAYRMMHHGYGLISDLRTFTSEEVVEKMAEIIDNPSYKEKVVKAGKILKSMPMDPRQTSVFWIEHVLEFGGEHLRSYGAKMPWYSFYMIDILLFFELVIVVLSGLCIALCFFLVKRFSASKPKEKRN